MSIRRYFEFDKKGALWRKEIIGGISTFIAMSYILAVQPSFLIQSPFTGSTTGEGIGSSYTGALFLGVALVSFIGSILMGLLSKVPISTAPGMGLNVFFVYTVSQSFHIGFEGSLYTVLFSGILYLIIACTSLRQKMMKVFPENLKIAIGTMIGLFIAYVGLANMGIITPGVWGAPTNLGDYLNNPIIIVSIVGIFLLLALYFMKVPFPILFWLIIGIIMLAIVYASNPTQWSNIFVLKSYDEFSLFGNLQSQVYSSKTFVTTFTNPLAYVAILTFLFVNFFDASGTMFSVGKALGIDKVDINENGWKNWLNRANVAEGSTTVLSSFFLQSSVVAYVESNTAHVMGAKTGFSAIVTGLCFLVVIALWPILSVVFPISIDPNNSVQPITGPILVLVGVMMIRQLKDFSWKNFIDIPMLLFVLAFGVLGFSISNGIAWGLMVFVFLNFFVGLSELFASWHKFNKNKRKNKFSQDNNSNQDLSLLNKFNWKETIKTTHLVRCNMALVITSVIALLYTVVDSLILAKVISF